MDAMRCKTCDLPADYCKACFEKLRDMWESERTAVTNVTEIVGDVAKERDVALLKVGEARRLLYQAKDSIYDAHAEAVIEPGRGHDVLVRGKEADLLNEIRDFLQGVEKPKQGINRYAAAIAFLEAEAQKIPLGQGNTEKGFSSTYNALMFCARALADADSAAENRKCESITGNEIKVPCILLHGHSGFHTDGRLISWMK
jgi:hypothetical protein